MQHGILRVGIMGENTKEPCFTFVEAIDLQDMVKWKSLPGDGSVYDDALMRSLERIHDQLWENLEVRPGWEVIVHHSERIDDAESIHLDITFAFHHAYADGVASKLFHRDLLRALCDSRSPPAELQGHVLKPISKPDLLPGMEEMVPFKISWGYLLRTIWSEIIWQNFVPNFIKSKPLPISIPWTGKDISVKPHRANARLVHIPRQTLSQVLRACREHSVTLTPLLHALIAASLSRRLSIERAPALSFTTPIDLRRYAKPEYDVKHNIAGLVSAHDDIFKAQTLSSLRNVDRDTDESIWNAATSLSVRLRQKVSTLPNDDIVGMLSWVSDWEKFWTDKFGAKRGSTWEVSNIGSLPASTATGEGDWTITRSVMTQGALPVGSAFSVNVAGVEGEGLCLSLTWQETIVERELMEGLAKDLEKWSTVLAENGGFAGLEKGG